MQRKNVTVEIWPKFNIKFCHRSSSWFFSGRTNIFGQLKIYQFGATCTCVKPVSHVYMELNGRDAVQICFWQWASKCYINMTIINRVCVYDYSILTIFDYNFSVRLPIINVWHFYSLCATLSGIVGALGMWACSILLSFNFMWLCIRHLNDIIKMFLNIEKR